MLKDILDRIERRLAATKQSATAASRKAGLSLDAIRNMRRTVEAGDGETGGVSSYTLLALAPVLGTSAAWLLEGIGPEGHYMVPLIGTVGAERNGVVTVRQHEFVAAPTGVSADENIGALEVQGSDLRGFADDGSLIYFEKGDPEKLLRSAVVAKLVDGPVVLGRLMRGEAPGLFELEPLTGETLSGRLEWAACVMAIIQPTLAKRISRVTDPADAGDAEMLKVEA